MRSSVTGHDEAGQPSGARPRTILHSAVSRNWKIDGFEPDLEAYYGLIPSFGEDVTFCGSQTILDSGTEADRPGAERLTPPEPDDSRPDLAIVDSDGRVNSWGGLIRAGHWKAGIALCSRTTPRDHRDYLKSAGVETIVAGDEHVDLQAALAELYRRGARVVRIDSGPKLSGLVLKAGLVDEVSLLVHPVSVRDGRHFAGVAEAAIHLKLRRREDRGDGLTWERYSVERPRLGAPSRTLALV